MVLTIDIPLQPYVLRRPRSRSARGTYLNRSTLAKPHFEKLVGRKR